MIAEIRILSRAVANDPTKRVSDIKLTWQDPQGRDDTYTFRRIVKEVADIEAGTSARDDIEAIGLLQAVKDELISKTQPATGLTIAYTALVAGSQRTLDAESSYWLAQQAYGNLTRTANRHRRFMYGLAAFALWLAIFAAWEATKISLGKSLLEVLEPLRAQQAVLIQDKFRLEESIDKATPPAQGPAAAEDVSFATLLPVCDRYRLARVPTDYQKVVAGMHLHSSPEIREVCGRDEVLAADFHRAHLGLQHFGTDWPGQVGGLYGATAKVVRWSKSVGWMLIAWIPVPPSATLPSGGPCASAGVGSGCDAFGDVEFQVAPVIQAISSYILPFTFGVIGSLLYVLLQHYTDLRTNTLSPKEFPVSVLRVILGVVVAACVSLLITSYAGPSAPVQPVPTGTSPPQALVGSLTLSASGITFLAGFGAEAVFRFLQTLVERVFQMQKA
ncbi:MAG TPA: hypothetical protein VME92_04860 [Acetobacteraceae bacterium]|nr:hypothetical protein [Acetobacteraceae bacterium]